MGSQQYNNKPNNYQRRSQAKLRRTISLDKISCYNPNYQIDERKAPLQYRGYTIFFVKETIYWYVIRYNGSHYKFDIRPICEDLGLGNAEGENETWDIINNHEAWLVETFAQIEQSPYYLDIEESITRANDAKIGNKK